MTINPLIYGTRNVRIVLQASGVNTERLTFQSIREGTMKVIQAPEGVLHQTGGGGGRKLLWSPKGFRVKLECEWDYSLDTSGNYAALTATSELWVGGVWGAPTIIENAEALRRLYNSAFLWPRIVYPHLDDIVNFFTAQPDPKSVLRLSDEYGFAHGLMKLTLVARDRGTLAGFV